MGDTIVRVARHTTLGRRRRGSPQTKHRVFGFAPARAQRRSNCQQRSGPLNYPLLTTERQHLAAMGTLLLDIALFVSAVLLIPPAYIVASKGPIDGIKELFGEDFVTPYDEDSYFLKHAMMIDCSKNWFLAALYLAAITFDAAAKEKVAILATLLMMLCVSANMIAPPTASIAPYPSL